MLRINTLSMLFLTTFLCFTSTLVSQIGIGNPNLSELPISLSWDNDGVRITAKTSDPNTNLLEMTPFRYLDQIGNDLIRVAIDARSTPVVIDLTGYYQNVALHQNQQSPDTISAAAKIGVYMPRLTLADYNEPNSFIIELRNFTDQINNAKQAIVIKGLDVLYVGSDNLGNLSAKQNRIVVNVEKSRVKHLLLKGGILNLFDLEQRIPNLCQKYNERYFANGRSDAFVCLRDCKADDTNSEKSLRHGRTLITKYNITDFDDVPISFLGNMIITKKGLGINLKTEATSKTKTGKKEKQAPFDPYDNYTFFPWYEFINLNFSKYVDENQLLIKDPYNHTYIYNSKVYFSNVELIQFFNELKAMITTSVNHYHTMR